MASLPPFQQLLDRHARDVLAYLTAMLGSVDADDAFQETFLAALRAYPGLRDSRNLRGWLFAIAHRKAIDSRRQRAVRPSPSGPPEKLAELAAAISAGALFGGASPGPESIGPGDGPAAAEIWRAVEALPPKQRAAVTLRFAGDLSHREIASAIDCSEAAARRSLHEGLSKLREEWT